MYDALYGRALLLSFALSGIAIVLALMLQRRLAAPLAALKSRWRPSHTAIGLAATCLFLAWFIVHFGRHQFGGFDYNVLMELGWRQHLGQIPYTDFLASTPPGFNLGIKFAYAVFGVSWDANLYLSALFAVLTFLWLYWLFLRLTLTRLAAFVMAFSIESAAMLTLCFWWYNNSTTILAAVFFLSALLYTQQSLSRSVQLSYVLSLALLSLFKPNMAGIVLVAGVLLVLIAASRTTRTFLRAIALTLSAAALAIFTLAANHISIPTLLAVYRNVAGERGFALIGFHQMHPLEQLAVFYWLPALSIPFLALIPRIRTQIAQRAFRPLAATLFLLVGPLLAFYGAATNGEFRDVECTVLLAAAGIVLFALHLGSPALRRIYIALLAGAIASQLYLGVIRLRVDSIGPHMFFEWSDNQNLIPSGVLKNMRVSATMIAVEREVAQARAENPGPYYLGPRVDFNYSVLDIPSPIHLPAWWHPGTAFARARIPDLLEIWQQYHFATLIYLKDDYTYYPDEFLDLLAENYTRDDRYPHLTIYHRK